MLRCGNIEQMPEISMADLWKSCGWQTPDEL
jgi:hypothetical protein